MPVEKKSKCEPMSSSSTINNCGQRERDKSKTSSINHTDSDSNAVQITALNHESRRSAFSPYRVCLSFIEFLHNILNYFINNH